MSHVKHMSALDDYQHRAIDELYASDICFAIMPMGSGKTVCGLTAGQDLIEDDHIDRFLVLGPRRVAHKVWVDEAREWQHLLEMNVDTVVGRTPAGRRRVFDSGAAFVCVNYDLLPWLLKNLHLLDDGCRWGLIYDETTRLKDPSGSWSRAITKIRRLKQIKVVWGFTGTPRPNRYQELYGQGKAIAGNHIWQNEAFTSWRNRQFNRVGMSEYEWSLIPSCRDDLMADLNTIGFTVRPEDLPQRPEPRIIDITVDVPDHVLDLHKDIMKEGLIKVDGVEIEAGSAGVAAGKQHQIAQGFVYAMEEQPLDLELLDDLPEDVPDPKRITLWLHDAKLDALKELVSDLNGQPLMVFYQYQEDLRRLKEAFGMPHLGKGVSDVQASATIDAWNAGRLPLLAMHPASAGHGLNMQYGGSYMCWYGIPFSNELYQQAIKRLDRRGQAGDVVVYRILTVGTHDWRICYELLSGRERDQRAFIRDLRDI